MLYIVYDDNQLCRATYLTNGNKLQMRQK